MRDTRTQGRSLGASLAGAAAVLAAIWLTRPVVPEVLFVPDQASNLAILLVIFGGAGFLVRRGRILEAAALLAGAGATWALFAVRQLTVCQSDLLYRPCTLSETAWMALPPLVVLTAGSVLILYDLRHTRAAR